MSHATPINKKPATNTAGDAGRAMKLMQDMGARSFDPMPPDQYLTFMDPRYSPKTRVWAWCLSKTIRQGHFSPWCVDEHGRELTIDDCAKDLGLDPGNARRSWRDLVEEDRVFKKGPRRLWVRGSVELPALKPQAAEADAIEEEGEEEENKTVPYRPFIDPFKLPELKRGYLQKQIFELDANSREALSNAYAMAHETANKALSDAVAAVRHIFDQEKDTILHRFGIIKRREKEDTSKRREVPAALIPVFEKYVQTSFNYEVQTFSEVSTPRENGLHTSGKRARTDPASLLIREKLEEDIEAPPRRSDIYPPPSASQPALNTPTEEENPAGRQADDRTEKIAEILEDTLGKLLPDETPQPALLRQIDQNLGEAPVGMLAARLKKRIQGGGRFESMGVAATIAAEIGKKYKAHKSGGLWGQPPMEESYLERKYREGMERERAEEEAKANA